MPANPDARAHRALPTPESGSIERTPDIHRVTARAVLLVAVLPAALSPFSVSLAAEPARPDGEPASAAWQWAAIYKADLLHVDTPCLTTAVGNLDLSADIDAGALIGWEATTFHTELLWDHGGKPNRRVGTSQGITNLEVAQNAARVYATWVEHEFTASRTRLLFGLYDLNSEFYATDASAQLVHPSFGIGIDLSQSGRNGPSVFPNLGLGVRLRQEAGDGHYAQIAVIDGVPGDPEHPGRTVVRLKARDGALLAGEFGWQQRGADGSGQGHWGLGLWQYTQSGDRIGGGASARSHGAYAIAQTLLRADSAGRTIGFFRIGGASPRANPIDLAFDAGVSMERPFGARGPGALTAGVAVARYGGPQRAAQAELGVPIAQAETALEIGMRWQVESSLSLQPLVQRVWHPGGSIGAGATIVGVRLEWSLWSGRH